MKRAMMGIVLVSAVAFTPATPSDDASAPEPSACVVCHLQLEDVSLELWSADVHALAGLGCVDCHGGDPSPELAEDMESMSEDAGFRVPPDRLHVAEFCAGCHADPDYMKRFDPQLRIDQFAEYRTSHHGLGNAAGDPVPATCTDCHGIHGILPVSSPDSPVYPSNVPGTCGRCHADSELMAPYGIVTDQVEHFRRSVHGDALLERGDTAAPSCNDCHGNHGAVPPGVTSVSAICGQCHGREAALFRASAKRDLFDALDVPECSGCHGHHEIDHPSPALFHRESEPVVEPGRIISRDPLVAEVEALARGAEARVGWTSVLRPQLDLDDERLQHVVEIRVGEQEPLVLDASVGPDLEPGPRRVDGAGVAAELTIESTSGGEVQQGDTVRFTLVLRGEADAVAGPIEVNDRPGSGIDSIEGSICLTCHEPGDDCDQATERMHAALKALDREIREAEALLSSAEHAGMEVRDAQFELSSAGRTATIESRALIHSFEPERLIQRTEEGQGVAAQALAAAKAALEELRRRQVGLAISLVVILLVLVGLYLKIRQVDRERHSA